MTTMTWEEYCWTKGVHADFLTPAQRALWETKWREETVSPPAPVLGEAAKFAAVSDMPPAETEIVLTDALDVFRREEPRE